MCKAAKLNEAGSALSFSTYLGGSGDDEARALAIDAAGMLYLTGATNSTDFPTTKSARSAPNGGTDAFVAKIDAASSAEAATLTCAGTKTWLAGSGTWQTAANWSGGTLPVSTDDVCIPSGVTVTLSSGTYTINSLGSNGSLVFSAGGLTVTNSFNSDGAVTLNGGTLTLNNTSIINNTFTLSSGTLAGTGGLAVAGLTTWSGGTMSGSGVTDATGGLVLSGGGKSLSGRTLNNVGLATWTAGDLNFGSSAVLNNLVGATFDAQNNLNMLGGGNGTFNNAGLFKKSTGTGTTGVFVTFNNTGSVQLLSGTLSFAGGTHTGPFTGSAGTVFDFTPSGSASTSTFNAGADITAPAVTFTGGTANLGSTYNVTNSTTLNATGGGGTPTVNFNGTITNFGSTFTANAGTANVSSNPATAPTTFNVTGSKVNLNFNGAMSVGTSNIAYNSSTNYAGELTGPATLNISGLLTWTAGTMSGTGVTNANGGMSLSGGSRTLSSRMLNNAGTATWTAGDVNFSGAAVINNQAGATFDAQGNQLLNGTSTGTFNNAGLFKKSFDTSTTGCVASFSKTPAP
ncbi:MAG: SBBP repeat-containing protein [Acidobacteria bacterium]|nr:SBBP repeat-containing protein [Acidobacteriota bacterium]